MKKNNKNFIIPDSIIDLLLIEKTIDEFGYSPLDLSGGSGKKIYHKCDVCNKEKITVFREVIRDHGRAHKECKSKKIKETCLKKYGVDNPIKTPGAYEKRIKTCLEKFGVEEFLSSKDVRKQIEATNMERYGVPTQLHREEIQEKIKQINLERYGTETPSNCPEFIEKRKQTMLERYGFDNPFKVPEINKKIRENMIKTFGAEYPLQSKEIQDRIKKNNYEKYGNERWGGYKYLIKSKEYWLDQKFNKCKINPNQKLPPKWTQGCRNKFEIICSCGKIWKPQFFAIYNGAIKSCGHNTGTSFAEQEVYNYIKNELDDNALHRYKFKGYEFDIYIPDKKIAIEYNGLYWHSEECTGDKLKDYKKYKFCQENNIHYISIFEDEWIENPNRIKSFLKNLLATNKDRIKIRPQQLKVEYKESIDNKIREFLNKYHYAEGRLGFKHLWCCYYDNVLIGILGIGHPSRQSKEINLELKRVCLHSDYKCYGLWSYLLKNYVKPKLNGQAIISFSDNRRDTGNLYIKLGFEKIAELKPNYYWCKGQKRFHKSALRKTEEEKLTDKTETQLRQEQGYFKIWDCGKNKWLLQL